MKDLIRDVEELLEQDGFDYYNYSGCFDIIARKNYVIILKILGNIDSFQEEQANNLKILARSVNATASLIGTHTNREKLNDSVIYERFEIPTFTPATLERILADDRPFTHSTHGGYFVIIDANKLREKRQKKSFTQSELAEKIGATKKNIYEHETRNMSMRSDIAFKLEKIIGNVSLPVNLNIEFKSTENKSKGRFEKIVSDDLSHLGFSTSFIYKTPFNIIAKEREFMIFSEADEREKKIERNIPHMEGFSKITKKPVLIITKDESNFDIPSIEEKELKETTQKELKKILNKK